MKTEYAYHCTNVNPQKMIKNGFRSGKNGYTDTNLVKDFYELYLPKNPMFVSSIKTKVWDANAKYCLTIDISNLKKYPDFGYLIDFGAYVDENCMYWEDRDVKAMLKSNDVQKQKVANFIVTQLEDGILWPQKFTGQMSFDLLGTCAIDGNALDKDRIINIKCRNQSL